MTQDSVTRKYQSFKIDGTGILEAMNLAFEEDDSLLIFDMDKSEWGLWAYDELPPEIKKIYDKGKKRMEADEFQF